MPTSFLDNIGTSVTDALSGFTRPTSGDSISPSALVSQDDRRCRTTGITDKGIIQSARWKAILAGTVTAYNTYNSLRMAKLQRDLGKKYLKLAEEHREYYNKRYKILEESLTKEALMLPKYNRNKEQLNSGQMLISVRGRSAGKISKAMSCTGRYCTGLRAVIMNDQLIEQAVTESMVAGLAHRYTDREAINHNNLRWEKREQVLKLGRDIPSEAVSYASLASGTFGSLGKQAGMGAEGAISFLAYGRNQTVYPQRKPWNVGEYHYTPTKLESFKPKQPENYTKPKEPEQIIKLSG